MLKKNVPDRILEHFYSSVQTGLADRINIHTVHLARFSLS